LGRDEERNFLIPGRIHDLPCYPHPTPSYRRSNQYTVSVWKFTWQHLNGGRLRFASIVCIRYAIAVVDQGR
jgi:hypothetical protein